MSLATELGRALVEWSLHEEAAHETQVALMKWLSQQAIRLGVADHTYVVGGAVRNFVIKQPIKDIDMMIDSVALKGKDSEWLAKQLQRAIPVQSNLTTNQYGVAILTVKGPWALDGHDMQGEVIEIANARKESYGGTGGKGYKPSEVVPATAADDIKRREFTFNTLMWRLSQLARGPDQAEIVDLTGCGLADLKAGVMACPSDPDRTFSDDPTRMLRAIKFLVKYGFTIRGDVEDSIRRNAGKLRNAPPNALTTILIDTLLKDPKSAKKSLKEMKRLGLLDIVADLMRSDQQFGATMQRWANDRKVLFLFDMMDMGLPMNARIDFLSPKQQARLRQVALLMPEGEPEAYLNALKQPGKAMQDKGFIPMMAKERGLKGKSFGQFAKRVSDRARDLMLANPVLWKNPAQLRQSVRSVVAEASVLSMDLMHMLAEAEELELHIFDFDGTLFKSPRPPKSWDKGTGAWFGDPTTLDHPFVPEKAPSRYWNGPVVAKARKSISNPNVLAVMMTGRKALPQFRYRVAELLKQQGLNFDEVHLNTGGGSTATFKAMMVRRFLQQHPGITRVQMWDDRHNHFVDFEKAATQKPGVSFVAHKVKQVGTPTD